MGLFSAPKANIPANLACPVCKGTQFDQRRGIMDTRSAAMFDMAWANRGCTQMVCMGCLYVMTFADPK